MAAKTQISLAVIRVNDIKLHPSILLAIRFFTERLFDLCLFGFVGFFFLLGSGKGCGLWLWHCLDFSLTFFVIKEHPLDVTQNINALL